MISDGSRPATLAELAARGVSSSSSSLVSLQVLHEGRTNVHPILDIALDSMSTPYEEAVEMTIGGVAVKASSGFSELGGSTAGRAFASVVPGTVPPTPAFAGVPATQVHFAADFLYNPSFIYDSRHAVEVLITLDWSERKWLLADALLLSEVLEVMARSAAETANAPILLLQCPAAPHNDAPRRFRTDGSGEMPRVAQALAIRMAVGMPERGASERIGMLQELKVYCESRGLGLQANDLRLDRVRGEWWTVLSPDQALFEEARETRALAVMRSSRASAPFGLSQTVDRVQAVSCVGPARRGSSLAVLADLLARNIGVVGASISALQETAFINLLVPHAPKSRRQEFDYSTDGLVDGLGRLARVAALTPQQGASTRKSQLTRAMDYQVVRSGPYLFDPEASTGFAVWCSWQSASSRSLAPDDIPSEVQREIASDDRVRSCNIVYKRVRRSASGRTRGRAKYAVHLADATTLGATGAMLSQVCAAAQSSAAAYLARRGDPTGTVLVNWRERWQTTWGGAPL